MRSAPPLKHCSTIHQNFQCHRCKKSKPRFHSRSRQVCLPRKVRFRLRRGQRRLPQRRRRSHRRAATPRSLKAVRKSKNFEPLAVSFKRIRKIIEKANIKSAMTVNPRHLRERRRTRALQGRQGSRRYASRPKSATATTTAHSTDRQPAKIHRSLLRRSHGDGRKRSRTQESSRSTFRIAPRVHNNRGLLRNRRG